MSDNYGNKRKLDVKSRLRTAVDKIKLKMMTIDGDGPCCPPSSNIFKDLIKDLIDKPEDKRRNDI